MVVVVAKVVVAPNDTAEVVGVPIIIHVEYKKLGVGNIHICNAEASHLPKFTVGVVVVDDGQPPTDDPKPNCGLLK